MIDLDDLDAIGLGPECPDCGQSMDWLNCWNGCQDGIFDYWDYLQFEDPLWYSPGDEEICSVCKGQGGWWHCPDCEKCFDRNEVK